jgi:hypothetical protein
VTNWPARLVAHHLGILAVRLIPHLAENDAYSLDDRLTAGLDPDHLARERPRPVQPHPERLAPLPLLVTDVAGEVSQPQGDAEHTDPAEVLSLPAGDATRARGSAI